MRAHETKPTKSIPFICEWPLVGSLPAFVQKDPLDFVLHVARKGDVCGFHIGPFPVILVNKAEYVHSILVEHAYDVSKGRLIHRAFGGNGLFVSEGDFHRRQRKVMAPVFQPSHNERGLPLSPKIHPNFLWVNLRTDFHGLTFCRRASHFSSESCKRGFHLL